MWNMKQYCYKLAGRGLTDGGFLQSLLDVPLFISFDGNANRNPSLLLHCTFPCLQSRLHTGSNVQLSTVPCVGTVPLNASALLASGQPNLGWSFCLLSEIRV